MTFIVSNTGVVFEKDLGKDTESLAGAITEYNPDKTWHPSARKPEIDDDNVNGRAAGCPPSFRPRRRPPVPSRN